MLRKGVNTRRYTSAGTAQCSPGTLIARLEKNAAAQTN
jgi:hypothetical protein